MFKVKKGSNMSEGEYKELKALMTHGGWKPGKMRKQGVSTRSWACLKQIEHSKDYAGYRQDRLDSYHKSKTYKERQATKRGEGETPVKKTPATSPVSVNVEMVNALKQTAKAQIETARILRELHNRIVEGKYRIK